MKRHNEQIMHDAPDTSADTLNDARGSMSNALEEDRAISLAG